MSQCLSRPLLGLLLLVFPFAGRAGLPLELQAGIRASTFEVVLKKPAADPLSYEKALPFDLVPFLERNDQYRSIGTAFALGQNRYPSPGNSGGPLLDEAGHVVGIVLRKSANENLNYSLPIGIVLDAPIDKAIYDERGLTSLPFMRGTRTYAYRDEFHLPLPWFCAVTHGHISCHI
jgi:hypothetical protein